MNTKVDEFKVAYQGLISNKKVSSNKKIPNVGMAEVLKITYHPFKNEKEIKIRQSIAQMKNLTFDSFRYSVSGKVIQSPLYPARSPITPWYKLTKGEIGETLPFTEKEYLDYKNGNADNKLKKLIKVVAKNLEITL